ncbi:siderophore ABC transporter substrate-binding protein [Bartonella tribocorum]|uniref:Ferric anguibactin-binding protein n=1 Tax=Bartonella tribocorum (strain DSM 28219 / CCUG 45778 / CIP 105476 / IBS 506) TaxID=382640 RepID=A9IWZ5_BART1|nr:siderophore ABC transporter substrate-binding protein [Bartonella tribocorum]CAK02075.1 ferric anguibactin-binding protein [Bartonella tribocorum CIP 105476]CDO49339.1 ferric anguibactin-binding protein [Bartonella tribocorum]
MIKYMKWVTSVLLVAISFATVLWTHTSIANTNPKTNITIDHVSGTTSVPASPQKVIVFDLAALDNMKRLGIKAVVGVPEGKKPSYLQQFDDAKYEKIGTLFEPDYEKIATLQPDLIIISSRTQAKYNDLSKIAPTIDLTVGNDNSLEDIKRNVSILGKIFGKEQEAEKEIAKLNETLAEVHKNTQGKGTGLILMTSGGKISALGPKSRFDIFHSAFGIAPATDKLTVQKHGQLISPEFILETNPDWLLVIDRDAAIGREGQSAAQLLNNELVHRTTASKQNQIIYLDSWSWYRASGGLTGLFETAQQINEAFKKSK